MMLPALLENVHIYQSRVEVGRGAAFDIAQELRRRLRDQDRVRTVFAAAPSQLEVLDELVASEGIDWRRVDAFQLDEYLGLQHGAPERFGMWLREHLFDRVEFGSVQLIDVDIEPTTAARLYAESLNAAPIDLICCGIGVNGHIAFNDPPVADFADKLDVKVVELDDTCRRQQVDDGCFAALEAVPTHAVTLTVPRIMRADQIFCVVPGSLKEPAVTATFSQSVTTAWPGTILRQHPACNFYFDVDAARGLLAAASAVSHGCVAGS